MPIEELAKEALRLMPAPDVEGGPPDEIATESRARRVQILLREYADRIVDPLTLYRPLPNQRKFHQCRATERLLRGSNRAGKTLSAAVEFAWAVMGRHPHLTRKTPGAKGYPTDHGRAIMVGKDYNHIGEVMWRKLSRAGAFQIIFDSELGQWRSVNPTAKYDLERKELWKPAPPLIPRRLIEPGGIAWEDKASGIPTLVRLVNGWEIHCYSSKAVPPQGQDVDLVWIDEEIENEEWVPEVAMRGIIDRKGKFYWSATPQAATDQLYELHERAESPEYPDAAEFLLLLDENPYLDANEKDAFKKKLNPEQYRVRVLGEFALDNFRVYPEFDPNHYHGCLQFSIPKKWNLWMVVDPGVQTCAALFLAVPPKDESDQVFVFDEIYIKRASADKFADAVQQKTEGLPEFEGFVIDWHMGRQTQISGRTVEAQYSEALRTRGVRSRSTGSGFLPGSDDVKGREEALRGWLRVRPSGTAKLQIFHSRAKNLVWEFGKQYYQKVNGLVTEKRRDRDNHAVTCLEYFAALDPSWRKPNPSKAKENRVLRILREREERKARQGNGSIILGPKQEDWRQA
jgi:hypothetical protein